MKGKPLLRDEVPENARGAYDYDSQKMEFVPIKGKCVTTILRKCLECGKEERIRVGIIRDGIRGGNLTGKCSSCMLQTTRRRIPTREDHCNWNGGRHITPQGYVMIRVPDHPNAKNGYEFEHRIVMEEKIGRFLLPGETVHHKNGEKGDNRVSNLELWSRNHGDGIRYEDMTDDQLLALANYIYEILKSRSRREFNLSSIEKEERIPLPNKLGSLLREDL